jgi:hypothetical protein
MRNANGAKNRRRFTQRQTAPARNPAAGIKTMNRPIRGINMWFVPAFLLVSYSNIDGDGNGLLAR